MKLTIYIEPKYQSKLVNFIKYHVTSDICLIHVEPVNGHFMEVHVETTWSDNTLANLLVEKGIGFQKIIVSLSEYKIWTLFSANGEIEDQEEKLCEIRGINDILEMSSVDGYTRFVFTTHLNIVDLFSELSDKIPFGFLMEGVYVRIGDDFAVRNN